MLYSEDQGYHWRGSSKTFPDHPTFTFRSSHDGEYWFAVQTVTTDGKVSPTLDSTVEPNLKVIVDTFPPTLLLDPDKRRGSMASVRWEAKDENLDLKSLVVEYQVEGVGVWRRVPIKKPKLIGGQQWDAGTAEALKVRASVADKAGNVAEAVIDLPEGSASPPDLVTRDPGEDGPPGIVADLRRTATGDHGRSQLHAGESAGSREPKAIVGGGAIRPGIAWRFERGRSPRRTDRQIRACPRSPGRFLRSRLRRPRSSFRRPQPISGPLRPIPPRSRRRLPATAAVEHCSLPTRDSSSSTRSMMQGLMVPRRWNSGSRRTAAVPGFAAVTTRTGSRRSTSTWVARALMDFAWWPDRRRGSVTSRRHPATRLNRGSRSTAHRRRSSSSRPRSARESTPARWRSPGEPAIFTWRPNPSGCRGGPISPTPPGKPSPMPRKARASIVWTVPPTVPQRFHLKVEAVDSVGHQGSAETTDMGPIMVDRSRPRSRIIGLDPNARSGIGPTARPMRERQSST